MADDAVYRAALARAEAPVEGGGHPWPDMALEARAGVIWPAATPAAFPGEMDHAGRRTRQPRAAYRRSSDTGSRAANVTEIRYEMGVEVTDQDRGRRPGNGTRV